MTDKQILIIQTAGFIVALAVLPFLHSVGQILFSIAFAVHFVGDMLRLHKDGVI